MEINNQLVEQVNLDKLVIEQLEKRVERWKERYALLQKHHDEFLSAVLNYTKGNGASNG